MGVPVVIKPQGIIIVLIITNICFILHIKGISRVYISPVVMTMYHLELTLESYNLIII